MKKHVIVLIFSAISLLSSAKTYTAADVIKDGTVWHYRMTYVVSDPNNPPATEAWAVAKGNATYNDKDYVTIYYTKNQNLEISDDAKPMIALRVDGDKVYAYTFELINEPEVLVYDFGVQPGDEISLTEMPNNNIIYTGEPNLLSGKVKCDSREKYITCGNEIEIIELTSYYPSEYYESGEEVIDGQKWIAGMGSQGAIEENIVFEVPMSDRGVYLSDITVDGIKVYDENDLKPYINSVDNIELEKNDSDLKRFRPNGLPFNAGEKGIYIENGKTHIAY